MNKKKKKKKKHIFLLYDEEKLININAIIFLQVISEICFVSSN